ncbi:MAG: PHP domain-containing protein [Clostridia bacterium]|nr:PHP domain-containing protein [Clostridia bacterium]
MLTIQCDTHTHTLYSRHAYSTLEENVRAAKAQGLTLLAGTDHYGSMLFDSYDLRHYDFLRFQHAWPRECDGVTLLRGVEADITTLKGDLFGHEHMVTESLLANPFPKPMSMEEYVFEPQDFAIASVHNRQFAKDATPAQGTEMYCRAMENKKVLIIGHIVRGGVPFNMDEVLQHAKKTGVLIEINENSLAAQDGTAAQCCRVAERCAELNVPISLGTDAHLSYRVGRFPCALAMLDKIGFPEELVASRTKESFLSALSNAGLSIH